MSEKRPRFFGLITWLLVAPTLLLGLNGCAPETTALPTPTPVTTSTPKPSPSKPVTPKPVTPNAVTPGPKPVAVTFVSATDGDTIVTSAGVVRIIGVDAPERGECGYEDATRVITQILAPGDEIELSLPKGQNDVDKYDRLLRYVTTTSGVDLGMHMIRSGNAVARYDSRNGYPAHPLEGEYRSATVAELTPGGKVLTVACKDQQQAADAASTAPDTASASEWWRQYSSCAKLKKNTAGHTKGPFNRDNPDEWPIYEWFVFGTGHNGDGDNDGLACE